MNEHISTLLEGLESKNSAVARWEEMLKIALNKPQTLSEFIAQLCQEIKFSHDHIGDRLPFYHFLHAIACYAQHDYEKAKKSLAKSILEFHTQNSQLNEALAEWLFGIIHFESGETIRSQQACETALHLLELLISECEKKNAYNQAIVYKKYFEKIEHFTKEINAQHLSSGKEIPTPNHLSVFPFEEYFPQEQEVAIPKPEPQAYNKNFREQKTKTISHEAHLAFPVYDGLVAGTNKQGRNIFDGKPSFTATIEEIAFEELPHRTINLRGGGTIINLTPNTKYLWYRIRGDSMNSAKPIPLSHGDYVLVNATIKPSFNDIVVAALVKTESTSERAGVVKRFRRDGLYSESTSFYDPISLRDVEIMGVVVAVAKQIGDIAQRALIRFTINEKIATFSPSRIENILVQISSLLGILITEIEFIYLSSGSSRLTCEIPDDQVPVLLAAFAEKNVIFAELKITHIEARRAFEISESSDNLVESFANPTIERIRESIISNPIKGSQELSHYLFSKPEFTNERIEVDLMRSELERIKKEALFGHTNDLDAQQKINTYRLLGICSKIK